MPEVVRRGGLAAFVLLCVAAPLTMAWEVAGWGRRLSPVDHFSEANILCAATNFARHGIASNTGLSQMLVDCPFPEDGFAAFADQHFQVEKSVEGGRTYTRIQKMDPAQRIEELARMLGGVTITKVSRDHARQLLKKTAL